MRDRSPTTPPAPRSSRSTRRRPSPRTRSGGIAASSTRAAAIRRAPRSSAASRRSRARASGSPTPPAWPRSPAPCSCCARAITWSSPTISTAVRTGSSRRSSPTSACASPTSTRPTRGGRSKALEPATRMVWIESPTNPMLRLIDIAACAEIARRHGAWLVVDNTFATPFLQNPIALGAHVVVHSTTKYLGGHSDVIGGAVVVDDAALFETLRFAQNATGGVPGPWDAWLTLRGTKTLAVRMRQHETNARRVAEALRGHAQLAAVHYPGFADHPGHAIARKQMRGFGGMVTIELRGGEAAAEALRIDAALLARREPRRRRVADRVPVPDEPRRLLAGGEARQGNHRRRGAALGRARRRRRPLRRPPPGARAVPLTRDRAATRAAARRPRLALARREPRGRGDRAQARAAPARLDRALRAHGAGGAVDRRGGRRLRRRGAREIVVHPYFLRPASTAAATSRRRRAPRRATRAFGCASPPRSERTRSSST